MTRASKLMDAKDFDGAYAVAADAQQANTSPTNYMAAYFAGVAAFKSNRLDLAEEHLRFASSTEASNPAWVQFQAWEAIAFVKLQIAFSQMSGQRDADIKGSPDALAAYYRRASATMADADAAMSMAIDIAANAGAEEDAKQLRVKRAGMRRIRDNITAMSELRDLSDAIRRGGSAELAIYDAMIKRIDAIFAAKDDLCEECDAKKRSEEGDAAESGDAGPKPAGGPPVS